VFGLFDSLFIIFVVGMICKSSRIVVNALGLQSRQDWKFMKFNRQFTPTDLIGIKTTIGMTSNEKVYYDLKAFATNGRTFTLATSVPDKKEAEWLAAEMNRLLKLDKPAPPDNVQA
jgi:hypothetical protein